MKIYIISIFFPFIFLGCSKPEANSILSYAIGSVIGQTYNLNGDSILVQNLVNFLEIGEDGDGGGFINFENSKLMVNASSKEEVNTLIISPGNIVVLANQNGNINGIFPNTNNQYFGSNINIGISSTNYGQNYTLYMPHDFTVISPTIGSIVSKSSGFTLEWTTDSNPLNDKGVLIELTFDLEYNILFDPNLSGDSMVKRFLVPDNGSYTISSSDLMEFPKCKGIFVSVQKGDYKNYVINSKNFPIALINKKMLPVEFIN